MVVVVVVGASVVVVVVVVGASVVVVVVVVGASVVVVVVVVVVGSSVVVVGAGVGPHSGTLHADGQCLYTHAPHSSASVQSPFSAQCTQSA